MRAGEGFGVVSLLAVAGFLWGMAGLVGSSEERDGVSAAEPIGSPAHAPAGRALSSRASGLDWGPAGAVEAAVGLSVAPVLDVFLRGDGRRRPLRAATTELAPPTGLASVSSLARGRPVAEPPLWLVLSLVGGVLWSRHRAQGRQGHPGAEG